LEPARAIGIQAPARGAISHEVNDGNDTAIFPVTRFQHQNARAAEGMVGLFIACLLAFGLLDLIYDKLGFGG
jgi:hypothetical protein